MKRSETAKLWAARLQRFEHAQMSVAQFCNAEGISQPSFYQWKRKLKSPQNRNAATTAGFMPVALAPNLESCSAPVTYAKATMELPGGIRIVVEVPTEIQAATSGPTQAGQVQS